VKSAEKGGVSIDPHGYPIFTTQTAIYRNEYR